MNQTREVAKAIQPARPNQGTAATAGSPAKGFAPPAEWQQLAQMVSGYATSQLIYAAARLGLADLLLAGPQPSDALAHQIGVDADRLHRMLLGLGCVGVVLQDELGRFGLTAMGRLLCRDAPGTLYDLVLCGDESYRAWGEILHTLTTGEAGFDRTFGMGRYAYLDRHPEAAATFQAAMGGLIEASARAVVAAYDFAPYRHVVDVGGGRGTLLATVLSAFPHLQGTLFDTASGSQQAASTLVTAGLAERTRVVTGDFFTAVPPGGDLYLLSHTVHNWQDDRAVALLRNCRTALGASGTLLLVEMVLPDRLTPSPAHYQLIMTDLQMMMMTGGRERTATAYGDLLEAAGFRLQQVLPTRSPDSILVAVPV